MRHRYKNRFENYRPLILKILKAIWTILNFIAVIKTLLS